jgi:hypothetical protein
LKRKINLTKGPKKEKKIKRIRITLKKKYHKLGLKDEVEKNQSFTIVPKTKIINQVKKDQNEYPLKSEDNDQHEF